MAVKQQTAKALGDQWLVDDYEDLASLYPSHGDEAWVINEKEWYKYEADTLAWRQLVSQSKSIEDYVAASGEVASDVTEGVR